LDSGVAKYKLADFLDAVVLPVCGSVPKSATNKLAQNISDSWADAKESTTTDVGWVKAVRFYGLRAAYAKVLAFLLEPDGRAYRLVDSFAEPFGEAWREVVTTEPQARPAKRARSTAAAPEPVAEPAGPSNVGVGDGVG